MKFPVTAGLCLVLACLIFSLPGIASAQQSAESTPAAAETAGDPTASSEDPAGEAAADAADTTPDASDVSPEELSAEEIEKLRAEQQALAKDARKRYDTINAEFSEATLQMRAAHIRFMNEDSSDAAATHYRDCRNQSRKKMNELFDAGVEVLRIYPEEDVARFMATALQHRFERDHYDSATMEVGARLIDGGLSLNYIFLVTARAAMAAGDTELATRLYKALKEEDVDEIDKKLTYLTESIQKQHDK